MDFGSISMISSASGTSQARRIRINVVIFGGDTVAIPLGRLSTFGDLQNEALRRANALQMSIPHGELALRLDSSNGPMVFPEDEIEDILDGTGKLTVHLCANSNQTHNQETGDKIVIRWITAALALDYPDLDEIPYEILSISKNTTIKTLKSMAKSRLYNVPGSTEAPLLTDSKVELFFMQCAIRTTDESTTTLTGLGCSGTRAEPLNIFVVPMSLEFADVDDPHKLWGFDSTDRGIATFQTCLKFLLQECESKDSAHRRMLKTLFHVTHFPPVLEALHLMKEEKRFHPYPLAILATCFRELCFRMVPASEVGGSVKAILQGSRQVFAWLESVYESFKDGYVDDPEAPLVRSVKLRLKDGNATSAFDPGKRKDAIIIKAKGSPNANTTSDVEMKDRDVEATVYINCRENTKVIALALWGTYDEYENYYIDFRGSIPNPVQDKRKGLNPQKDFPNLLKMANESQRYRLMAPKSLDELQSEAITLSKDGYVSQFGVSSGDFKDFKKSTWNAISSIDILNAEPGDEMMKDLEPIIEERQKSGTWTVDNWETPKIDEESPKPSLGEPAEAIVICFDLSWSMGDKLGDGWVDEPNSFTKLIETKQVFDNVIGRMLGYQLNNNHVGVVTFSNNVNVRREIGPIHKQEFAEMAGEMKSSGMTALWDALMKAHDMLLTVKANHPKSKLRIIVLTDGDDNHSTNTPQEVCEKLYQADIVLDSIVIGEGSTTSLFKMSKATGGYAFYPTSRLLLYQIFLLEPFLDISARPDIRKVVLGNFNTATPKTADMKTMFDFPPSRKHKLESGNFISLSVGSRFFSSNTAGGGSGRDTSRSGSGILPYRGPSSTRISSPLPPPVNRPQYDELSITSSRSSITVGRVFQGEIASMASVARDDVFKNIDVYINEADMTYWKVVMPGPVGSPYEKGTFVLSVQMTDSFPNIPPVVRFLTPILHPNVTKHGRICHQIFTKGWKSSYHVHTVLQYMQDLLKNPETDDAVDELATLKFWTDIDKANQQIEKYVEHFARHTREEYMVDILRGPLPPVAEL